MIYNVYFRVFLIKKIQHILVLLTNEELFMTKESGLNKVNEPTLRGGETTNVHEFCNQYQCVIKNMQLVTL